MTNIDVLIQSPWRETIPSSSPTEIPEGAAATYVGPCIGDNVRFAPISPYGYRYRIEVLAQGAGGQPLGYGQIVVYVQSAYLTAKQARQRLQQGSSGAVGAPPPQPVPGLLPGQNPFIPYGGFPSGATPGYGVLQ
jgi:hypothetical protein